MARPGSAVRRHGLRPPPTGLAVVTGASAGIGSALAAGLARRGHPLLLVARREPVLREVAADLRARFDVDVEVLAADLADASARADVVARLREAPVGVLCNNAGTATFGPLAALEPAAERAQLELNVVAVHDLTLAVLPGMRARGRGGLLFSGSVAGDMPIPNNTTYAAGKAFVNNFAEALHHELRAEGIAVTLLAPGPTREVTGTDGVAHFVPGRLWASAAETAEAALAGLDRNRVRVVPGATGRGLALLARFGPRRVLTPTIGRVYAGMRA